MSSKKKKLLLAVLLLLTALEAWFLLPGRFSEGYRFESPGTVDLLQYWTALRLVLADINPFDPEAVYRLQSTFGVKEIIIMRSPPWTLVLLAPVLMLPFFAAALTWILLNLLMCVSSTFALLKSSTGSLAKLEQKHLPTIFLFTVSFYPIWETVLLGQLSILLLFCLSLFLLCLHFERAFLAGMFLAPLSVKPHLFLLFGVVLGTWSLQQRNFRIIAGGTAGFALLLAATFFFSPTLIADWLSSLASETTVAGAVPVGEWKTTSLAGATRVLIYLLSGEAPRWPIWVVPMLGLTACLIYLIRRPLPADWNAFISPVLCLSLLFSPYGWFFDHAILLIVQLQICVTALTKTGEKRLMILGALGLLQAVMLFIAVLGESGQHRFFWVPIVLLLLWIYTRRLSRQEGRAAV